MAGKLLKDIQGAYQCLSGDHDFIVCEGTGHVGVGAIGGVSNATVASSLGSDVVLVSEGGLGSAFDKIYLNRQACAMAGANVVGVVLNKVIPEKRDMIEQYFKLALRDWGIPLLGCIPFDDELERVKLLRGIGDGDYKFPPILDRFHLHDQRPLRCRRIVIQVRL